VVADEIEHVAVLEELAEDEHARLRSLRADRERGAQAVVRRLRRHLDIGDDDVGLVGVRLADEVRRLGRDGHDLEPALLENAHDALAHERLVLADDDADRHGPEATPVAVPGSG
jgi:predicted TPR repeat methyltransferase